LKPTTVEVFASSFNKSRYKDTKMYLQSIQTEEKRKVNFGNYIMSCHKSLCPTKDEFHQ